MYVRMLACAYVYMCIYECVRICACIYVRTYVCMCAHICTCVCVCVYTISIEIPSNHAARLTWLGPEMIFEERLQWGFELHISVAELRARI